jgi:hypothetical protein
MRIVTLITALLLSVMIKGQKPLGLEKFTDDMETYDYGFKSDGIPSAIYIATVISELKRVLALNKRTLESHDEYGPSYISDFNSFDGVDIKNEMIAGFAVCYKYIISEYTIYFYAYPSIEGNYLVGFLVDKTSKY